MNALFEKEISCPYCGEVFSTLIDCSVAEQEYIEDCQVCCRPITFKVESAEGAVPFVVVSDENEA